MFFSFHWPANFYQTTVVRCKFAEIFLISIECPYLQTGMFVSVYAPLYTLYPRHCFWCNKCAHFARSVIPNRNGSLSALDTKYSIEFTDSKCHLPLKRKKSSTQSSSIDYWKTISWQLLQCVMHIIGSRSSNEWIDFVDRLWCTRI